MYWYIQWSKSCSWTAFKIYNPHFQCETTGWYALYIVVPLRTQKQVIFDGSIVINVFIINDHFPKILGQATCFSCFHHVCYMNALSVRDKKTQNTLCSLLAHHSYCWQCVSKRCDAIYSLFCKKIPAKHRLLFSS